ncbi:MAG: hypothetical protein M5U22_00790 [Thermoleophilia bacterium]|nr:hypothetical protein [Thermoleophilia bacterium]
MRIVLYGVVVSVVALLAAAAFVVLSSSGDRSAGGTTTEITDPAQIDTVAVAFVQNPYTDDYEITRIAGYLDNLGDKTIVSAALEIQLLGKDGGKDELVQYEVLNVPPHTRKSFDANAGTIPGPRTAEVKIVGLRVSE